jgi:hypothetical protein
MPELTMFTVWQRRCPAAVEDVKVLWNRLGALPQTVSAEERAHELCAAAYWDGGLGGVSTVRMGSLPSLPYCRLGFLRILVAPEHRLEGIALKLCLFSRDVLEKWSQDNPKEKLLGMAATIESPALAEQSKRPLWPQTGLNLVGYTPKGEQIRIVWFAHARLE